MSWERFQQHYLTWPSIGMALDLSAMSFPDDFFARMEPRIQAAFDEMDALERGAIANPDENRMVGHYWLRAPERSPTPERARPTSTRTSSSSARGCRASSSPSSRCAATGRGGR